MTNDRLKIHGNILLAKLFIFQSKKLKLLNKKYFLGKKIIL